MQNLAYFVPNNMTTYWTMQSNVIRILFFISFVSEFQFKKHLLVKKFLFCLIWNFIILSFCYYPQFAGLDLNSGSGPGNKYVPPHLRNRQNNSYPQQREEQRFESDFNKQGQPQQLQQPQQPQQRENYRGRSKSNLSNLNS